MQASFCLREISEAERWKILFVPCEMGGGRWEETASVHWAAVRTIFSVTSFSKYCLVFLKSCKKEASQYYEEGRICAVKITIVNYLNQGAGGFESQACGGLKSSCSFTI